MLSERLLKYPGFIYDINGTYYYLGKWICKKCTDIEATDCVSMYQMCRSNHEEPETNMYFQKIRAFSDFALEIPYDPEKIKKDMETVTENLSDASRASLDTQMRNFEEDCLKYCGKL